MSYIIREIVIRKFLGIWCICILSAICIFLIMLFIFNFHLQMHLIFIGFITTFISGLIIAFKLSNKESLMVLKENMLEFNNNSIYFTDIEGYYIDKQSPFMSQLDLKTTKGNFRITALKRGLEGRTFELFLNDFVKESLYCNNNIIQLNFFDIHKKQSVLTKTLLFILPVPLLILNLIFILRFLHHETDSIWKIIWVDILFLSMLSFYNRSQKKGDNKPQ